MVTFFANWMFTPTWKNLKYGFWNLAHDWLYENGWWMNGSIDLPTTWQSRHKGELEFAGDFSKIYILISTCSSFLNDTLKGILHFKKPGLDTKLIPILGSETIGANWVMNSLILVRKGPVNFALTSSDGKELKFWVAAWSLRFLNFLTMTMEEGKKELLLLLLNSNSFYFLNVCVNV